MLKYILISISIINIKLLYDFTKIQDMKHPTRKIFFIYSLDVRFVARLLPSRHILFIKQNCIMKKSGDSFPFELKSEWALYVRFSGGFCGSFISRNGGYNGICYS